MADVNITIRENGPYVIAGPVKVVDAEGNEVEVNDQGFALCRCGASSTKPFCDGTHRTSTGWRK